VNFDYKAQNFSQNLIVWTINGTLGLTMAMDRLVNNKCKMEITRLHFP